MDIVAIKAAQKYAEELVTDAKADIIKNAHESAGAIVCDASGLAVSVADASDKGLHHITLYGKSTQAITTGKQLFDITDLKQNLALGYSIDADDWIYYEGNNTSGTSDAYVNCVTNVSELIEVGKTYKLVIEVAMIIGSGSITACSNTNNTTNISQFTSHANVFKVGTHVFDLVARDSFDKSTSMLRNFVTVKAGCKFKTKFRISVLTYDETLTADTFKYEKFTGGVAQTVSMDNPIDIESVGDDGSVSVRVVNGENAQYASIDLSEPLRGLLVTSGGNYTDADGQQWVADTLEVFADGTGVRTKRIYNARITSSIVWNKTGTATDRYYTTFLRLGREVLSSCSKNSLCTHFAYVAGGEIVNSFTTNETSLGFAFAEKDASTLDDFNEFLDNNEVYISYPMLNPIITVLTAEQVQAFVALHSYKTDTIVTTDDMGDLAVEYIADSKTYIDNRFTELANAIVTLAE